MTATSSGGKRDRDQLRPVRLRTLPRRLGEPRVAEAAPCGLLDPGHIRVGTVGQSAQAGAGREQPRGLFVLVTA